VLVIGLTGGIGSGKSTVDALLAERGAKIIDGDTIAREVVEPGGPAFHAVVERFGDEVVGAGGTLDRAALAAKVFGDERARADLNSIVHPVIGTEMARRVAEEARSDDVVVMDIPLLAEGGLHRYPVAGVIVVDCPVQTAVERLVRHRRFTEADARARIAAQATREERLAIADVVVDNSGPRSALPAQIDKVWAWIEGFRAGRHPT
jgi:dephospho-CoA kinase